jgi:hypothetical protein
MMQYELIELFEVLEEFAVSLTMMAFAAILSMILFKAKNYVINRLSGSKETIYNPDLTLSIISTHN